MNETDVNNTLLKLKSNANSVVYDTLVLIRKKILQTECGVKLIRERRALEDLVNILHKPNEKILDVTLSILGNCCLEHESRVEVANYGIAAPLVAVLHNINRDSIQCRACRLVGNLAQNYNLALELHEKGVISGLVVAADVGENSIATRQMAVRALRMLWSVQSQRSNMLELNAVHKVAKLLATPYESKEERELLNAVIKALVVFSYQCSEHCARQICERGSDLHSLLSLVDQVHLKDSIIICISNLCHNANARLILGIANAVRIVVKELTGHNFNTLATTDVCSALVSTLCLFSRESVNRAKIRRAGGLPIILAIYRDSPVDIYKSRALHALAHFIYDEISLQELLKEGLVEVLISRLNDFVKVKGKVHSVIPPESRPNAKRSRTHQHSHKSENDDMDDSSNFRINKEECDDSGNWKATKRFRLSSPSFVAVQKENWSREKGSPISPSSLEFKHTGSMLDHTSSPSRWSDSLTADWSPSNLSCQMSPDSPPPYKTWALSAASPPHDMMSGASSPLSHSSTDCDWPEMYSPVCHDASSDEELEEGIHEEEKAEEPANSDKCDSRSSSPELQPVSTVCENVNAGSDQSLILNLLSRVSHMETPVEDLAVHNTLITLLDYITLTQNPLPRAARVLRRIVRNHNYFLKILTHQFVLSVHSRLCQPIHQHCVQCDKLDDIGRSLLTQVILVSSSGYGEGELSHHMLKSDMAVRRMLAVTIPYIVKKPRLLKRFLLEYRGLDILQELLCQKRTEEATLMEHIPDSLSMLAASLKISPPQLNTAHEDETCSGGFSPYDGASEEPDDGLSLILDDGSKVSTNKNLLCLCSPVFDAMLQGSFMESSQQSVRLQHVSYSCVVHLLYIMRLGRVPHCLPGLNLSTAMELLVTLDKFLVPGCDQLAELIIRQFLKPKTVSCMYQHMSEMGNLIYCNYIRTRTVEFILAAEITSKDRLNIFNELTETVYPHQALEDVFHLLQEKLLSPN
ncbi:armadillo repeat-containing protein 5 [Anabrus simplex]|uniref:armadillo repeat-containing protein 5 n=1 Tax=Anabrus simplex TaxID=316456 RepID=UPI0035A382A3